MDPQIRGAVLGGVTTAATLGLFYLLGKSLIKDNKEKNSHHHLPATQSSAHLRKRNDRIQEDGELCILLGDVGGTNVRLVLKNIYLNDKDRSEVLKEDNINSQQVQSFEEAVTSFLSEFRGQETFWPQAAVIGLAGPVDNNVCKMTNIKHWPPVDGNALSQTFDIPNFTLINDFAAAGHGILNLKEKDYLRLNDAQPVEGGVKVVIGPGTGLGQGFLTKSEFSPYYEVWPCEGGHVEFSMRTQEDFDLAQFAYKYIETSDNVENGRADGKINRISIERLCAGPAVPLIYDFMRNRYPEMERILENEGQNFKTMTSHDIIAAAIKKKDPLCLKVVDKFAEIFGVEVGNAALKTLPYGGIYLTGGVTTGITEYLLHNDTFLNAFYAKGRQEEKMRKVPVFIVKPENKLGLMGAEECARRILAKKLVQ